MGYAVYEDIWHYGRWAGYAVPAECDVEGCTALINRGMGYQCEEYYERDGDDWLTNEGCYLYFCPDHIDHHEHHAVSTAKPDHPSWKWWMLHHPSWEKWREENPKKVEEYLRDTDNFVPSEELQQDLEDSQ